MLAAHCPNCGSPVAISLSTPDSVSCSACGTQSPTPPRERSEIGAAAAILRATDQRSRQLTASARKAVTSSHSSMLYFGLALGLSAFPALLWTLGTAAHTFAQGRPAWEGLVPLVALTPLVPVGAAATWWLRRRSRNLEDACAARPPLQPNEPAGCAVCGAPLESAADGLVRCGYCQADNLVAPAVLERARKRQTLVFDNYADELQRRANSIGTASGVASGLAVGAGCAGPLATFALIIITTLFIFLFVDGSAGTKTEFVAVAHGQTYCLAELHRKGDGSAAIDFQGNTPTGLVSYREVSSLRGYRVHDATTLIGKSVKYDGEVGRITAVASRPILLDTVDVELKTGGQDEWAIPGLCFVDPADGAE
jgi:uncharacterized Zn finger protein (UPF0148 family)